MGLLKSYFMKNKYKNRYAMDDDEFIKLAQKSNFYENLIGYKIIKFLYEHLPFVILIGYSLLQIGLFISTRTFLFDEGWNKEFIEKLPIIFQPVKYRFAQGYTVILMFVFAIAYIKKQYRSNKLIIISYLFCGLFLFLILQYPIQFLKVMFCIGCIHILLEFLGINIVKELLEKY